MEQNFLYFGAYTLIIYVSVPRSFCCIFILSTVNANCPSLDDPVNEPLTMSILNKHKNNKGMLFKALSKFV